MGLFKYHDYSVLFMTLQFNERDQLFFFFFFFFSLRIYFENHETLQFFLTLRFFILLILVLVHCI